MVVKVLDLAIVNCRSCLLSVGKLRSLTYIKHGPCFESLPACLTNLLSLQTLDLGHSGVQHLPENFYTLSKSLRHLYVGDKLIDLPPRFGEFLELQTLDVFIVGKNNELSTLFRLAKLGGKLKIRYQIDRKKQVIPKIVQMLVALELDVLSLMWSSSNSEPFGSIDPKKEVVETEFLQPPPTVKNLVVQGWNKLSFPEWTMNQFPSLLNNLISLHITHCTSCQCLPSFSTILNFEYLEIWGLDALEWIESCGNNVDVSSVKAFFSSLKYLKVANLQRLKRWEESNVQDAPQKIFKFLSEIRISGRPNLMSIPSAPSLEILEASNIHAELLKQLLDGQKSVLSSTLKELNINSVHELESLSINVFLTSADY